MTDEEFAEQLLKPHADGYDMETAGDTQELHNLQAALRSYRRDSLHWAERRSAGQPSLADRARAQERWASLPQWALATVALVTIVGGVAHIMTERTGNSTEAITAVAPTMQHTATAAEISADNHLLSSIDNELSYHGASPVDGLRLRDGRTGVTVSAGATD